MLNMVRGLVNTVRSFSSKMIFRLSLGFYTVAHNTHHGAEHQTSRINSCEVAAATQLQQEAHVEDECGNPLPRYRGLQGQKNAPKRKQQTIKTVM